MSKSGRRRLNGFIWVVMNDTHSDSYTHPTRREAREFLAIEKRVDKAAGRAPTWTYVGKCRLEEVAK